MAVRDVNCMAFVLPGGRIAHDTETGGFLPFFTNPHATRSKSMSEDRKYRIEHDSMGELKVANDALWGAQTQRAVENFPVSGLRAPRALIRALGLIKGAAAHVNM